MYPDIPDQQPTSRAVSMAFAKLNRIFLLIVCQKLCQPYKCLHYCFSFLSSKSKRRRKKNKTKQNYADNSHFLCMAACTTRGNYTDDVYRDVSIKNARTSVTITSPNFPEPYPQNIQCTWRILAPTGHKVELFFLEFELEDSYLDSGCHDYVSVR